MRAQWPCPSCYSVRAQNFDGGIAPQIVFKSSTSFLKTKKTSWQIYMLTNNEIPDCVCSSDVKTVQFCTKTLFEMDVYKYTYFVSLSKSSEP
jgi:hypothetical protein